VIGALQVFTQSYVISNGTGSPAYASMFYNLYLFLNAFRRYRLGVASAQAWILMIIILLLTMAMFWVSRRYVHYESGDEGGI
jgi:multiple sugar transport system permease protein